MPVTAHSPRSANAYSGALTWVEAFPGRGHAYADADVRTKYTAALYWTLTTMTTVGYGDIVPLTNYERAFACCVELLGAVCTALVFGNVALLVQGFDGAGARLRERLATLNEFIARHEVPPLLAGRIRAAAAHAAAAHAGVDATATLCELPPALRAEVLTHLQAGAVQASSLFRHCAPGMVNAIVCRLRPVLVLPGDDVYAAGDAGRDLFFVARGALKLTSPDGRTVYAVLRDGDFFGEVEAVVAAGTRRGATATALTHCELHALSRDALADVLCDYPEYVEPLRAAAEHRAAAMAECAAAADAAAAVAAAHADAADGDESRDDEKKPAALMPPPPAALPAAAAATTATADAPDVAALAAAVGGGLGEAERALEALLTWQSAQAQALHRKLTGAPCIAPRSACCCALVPMQLSGADACPSLCATRVPAHVCAQRWKRCRMTWRASWRCCLRRARTAAPRPAASAVAARAAAAAAGAVRAGTR
jgi:CRP-like cAMP-binding protein